MQKPENEVMAKKKTVLVVVAHADDMEFMAAGTVARFVFEKGYDVYEYILTDNSKGSYRLPPHELIEISAQEALAAARVLGLKDVRFGGYPDGQLNETHPNTLREKIMAVIREVRADIVMSWDPFAPREGHPDHRAAAMATLDAAGFSGNPMFHPEHPHKPYMTTEAYWFAKSPWNAELFVDIESTMDKKAEALLKHDCQMAFIVDSLIAEAGALGADIPILQSRTPDGYLALMEAGIRRLSSAVGDRAGMTYAEQFRYEKLGMLDLALGSAYVEPDFAF